MLSPVHLKICGESLEKRNIKKTAQTGSGRNKNLHTPVLIDLLGLYHVIMPIIITQLVLQGGKMKQIQVPDWLPEQKRRRKKKVLLAI